MTVTALYDHPPSSKNRTRSAFSPNVPVNVARFSTPPGTLTIFSVPDSTLPNTPFPVLSTKQNTESVATKKTSSLGELALQSGQSGRTVRTWSSYAHEEHREWPHDHGATCWQRSSRHTGHSDMILGFGTNGLVALVNGTDNEQYALKYWLPWRANLSFARPAPLDSIERFVTQMNSRPGVRAKLRGRRVEIDAYGAAFPEPVVCARLRENKLKRARMPVTKSEATPSCASYSIAHGIQMEIVQNGVIRMPRAGPTLFEEMPLSLPDALNLVHVLAGAAASALIQGFAIADQKPFNVCRPPKKKTGWTVIDIDNLPRVSEPASDHATYLVDEVSTAGAASVASLVITVLLAVGVDHVSIDHLFGHDRPPQANCATLRSLMAPIDPSLKQLLSPLIRQLERNFQVSSATEALLAASQIAAGAP